MVASTCTPGPWSRGVLHQAGESRRHRHLQAGPAPFLHALAPSRAALVVGVAGLGTGSGLAARGTAEGLPVVWGPALDRHALAGGQATHDPIDAQQMAGWRRGGLRPHASVSPAALRATRALRRRRWPRTRHRAARLTPVPPTTGPDPRPARGHKSADQAHRHGVAARVPAPAVHQRGAVDRARMAGDDP
jgi:hypothetical protein